jgi:hypothetical protein
MVISMFSGWTGRPLSAVGGGWPRVLPVEERSRGDIRCSLGRGFAGTILVTTTSPEVCLKKTVYPDGRLALEVERGPERVLVTTSDVAVTVVRTHFTATVNVNAATEDDLARLRGPLVASSAIRWLRALVAVIEEMEQPDRAHLSLRFTGALVGQFDGDSGAIPRLCRELQASWSRRARPGAAAAGSDRPAFRRAGLCAAKQFESGVASYGPWHPARYGCAFTWLARVEAAWHADVLADPSALARGSTAHGWR